MNRILCLHSISEQGMDPSKFKNLVETLELIGFEFCLPSEIDGKGNKIAITFDDGYKDNYTVASQYLESKKIKAAIFIVTDFVLDMIEDKSKFGLKNLPSLDKADIEDLLNIGWELGFHTKSHINLYENSWDNIVSDFEEGHEEFVRLTGLSNNLIFAYPYGNLPINRAGFSDLLNEHNYAKSYTTRWGSDFSKSNYIDRVVIGDKDNLYWSLLKISGFVDVYGRVKWRGERFV